MMEPLGKERRREWGLEEVQKNFCSNFNAFLFLIEVGENRKKSQHLSNVTGSFTTHLCSADLKCFTIDLVDGGCRDDTTFREEINTCLKLMKPSWEVTAFQFVHVSEHLSVAQQCPGLGEPAENERCLQMSEGGIRHWQNHLRLQDKHSPRGVKLLVRME